MKTECLGPSRSRKGSGQGQRQRRKGQGPDWLPSLRKERPHEIRASVCPEGYERQGQDEQEWPAEEAAYPAAEVGCLLMLEGTRNSVALEYLRCIC